MDRTFISASRQKTLLIQRVRFRCFIFIRLQRTVIDAGRKKSGLVARSKVKEALARQSAAVAEKKAQVDAACSAALHLPSQRVFQ